MSGDLTLTERLLALWNHLGLTKAHIATQIPGSVAGLIQASPDRVAGLLFNEPIGFDPAAFQGVAERVVILSGDGGISAQVAASAHAFLPQSRRVILSNYAQPIWADHVRDHTETVVEVLASLPGNAADTNLTAGQGLIAGISYDIQGSGPALVLFPLFLAPTQWDAAIPTLTQRFTVIRLGGAYLGGMALLEDRARSPSYAGMVRTLHDIINPAPGETMLEIGCGSGALSRLAAARDGIGTVTASDINPFLLREAAALAGQAGLAERMEFREANAEQLPFADGSFDHAFSVTVLEECHADLALREFARVIKSGGRLGVIVRAIDLPFYWHVDLPASLRQKVDPAPQLVAPHGIADRSLYRRVLEAGFDLLHCFPSTPSFIGPATPFWDYMAGRAEARLDADELAVWRAAVTASAAEGTLFVTCPHHCVVAVKR